MSEVIGRGIVRYYEQGGKFDIYTFLLEANDLEVEESTGLERLAFNHPHIVAKLVALVDKYEAQYDELLEKYEELVNQGEHNE